MVEIIALIATIVLGTLQVLLTLYQIRIQMEINNPPVTKQKETSNQPKLGCLFGALPNTLFILGIITSIYVINKAFETNTNDLYNISKLIGGICFIFYSFINFIIIRVLKDIAMLRRKVNRMNNPVPTDI